MHKINTQKYTILCVDDNPNNLFSLRTLLEKLDDVRVLEAQSADEALKILLRHKVDLILSDIQMPQTNGFEFAKILQSNKKTREIPIIFVTAIFKSEEFIEYGFELGAVDYITKPIDDNQLLNKIRLYLKLFEEKERATRNEQRLYELAQSIGEGLYSIDNEGRCTFINKEALGLLGFEEKELLGKNIHNYIHYKDKENNPIPPTECKIHKAMQNGERIFISKDTLVKKDGSFLEVSITATPLMENNKIIGTVVIFHDRSDELKIIKLEKEKLKNQEQFIHAMIDMIESRDSYTAGHTKRVAKYCELIAKEMGYKQEDIELLKKAAWLHDIGKISTPDSILLKPGKLTRLEYQLIQDHLEAGYKLLHQIDAYKKIAEIVREHHEKFDGSGYPRGLKGNEIHPLGRIMIVADSFDAMTTNRIYKKKKSIETALKELEDLSGKLYHPEVVEAALKALKDIKIDENISQIPKTKIEEQRFAYFYKDRLTGLFIKEYLDVYLRDYIHTKEYYKYTIRLHNFSAFNKKHGWDEGDRFLSQFANYLQELFPHTAIFRIEGDDFLIISEEPLQDIKTMIYGFTDFQTSELSVHIEEEKVLTKD